MSVFRITGTRSINGRPPGQLVELDEDSVNVQALIDAGHIVSAPQRQDWSAALDVAGEMSDRARRLSRSSSKKQ